MALSRDDILAADDLPLEEVEVPEWGGVVYVRSMNGLERDKFDAWMASLSGEGGGAVMSGNLRARMVALCTTDESGNALFTEDDIAALGKKSSAALTRVADAASRLNGMSPDDVEDIAENSEAGPTGDSTSD